MPSSIPLGRLASAALSVAFLVGCGGSDDATGPEEASVAGTWTLQTANGSALPVDLVEDGTPFVLHSGRMVLSSDGSCTNSFTTTPEGEDQKTETLECTFALNGSSFSLVESAGAYTGTLSGSDLTVLNDGNSLLYRR